MYEQCPEHADHNCLYACSLIPPPGGVVKNILLPIQKLFSLGIDIETQPCQYREFDYCSTNMTHIFFVYKTDVGVSGEQWGAVMA